MEGYSKAKFPVDFTDKFLSYICEQERQHIDTIKNIYGESLLAFCEEVSGKTLWIKFDGVEDCFELEDDNWCVPLSLIEVLD